MVPSSAIDRLFGRLGQMEMFFMSNMSSQRPGIDGLGKGWQELESRILGTWAKVNSYLWVLAGPIFADGVSLRCLSRADGLRVPVPRAFYMVLVSSDSYPHDEPWKGSFLACHQVGRDAHGSASGPDPERGRDRGRDQGQLLPTAERSAAGEARVRTGYGHRVNGPCRQLAHRASAKAGRGRDAIKTALRAQVLLQRWRTLRLGGCNGWTAVPCASGIGEGAVGQYARGSGYRRAVDRRRERPLGLHCVRRVTPWCWRPSARGNLYD